MPNVHRTRKEALAAGVDQYFTGRPCPQGHIAMRRVSGACCECAARLSKQHQAANAGQYKAWKAASQKRNRHSANARSRKWEHANADQVRARKAAYDRAHPEKLAARMAKRRAALMQRTPSWANHDEIEGMYELAAVFRRVGLQVEVDHAIPLQGRTVSGLHVPENLQLLNSPANKAKSNSFAGIS